MKNKRLGYTCFAASMIPWGMILIPFGDVVAFIGVIIQLIGLAVMVVKRKSIWGS